MNSTDHTDTSDATPDKFYLPATAISQNIGLIEDAVTDLFDFHGVVLIPDSYNK